MFSSVWVPRNDLVETSSSSCLVIRRRAFGVAAIVLVVCENEIQARFFLFFVSVSSSRIVATLHITFSWLPLPIVMYGVDHTWQRTSASLIYEHFHGH